jgi:hypothetical protein
MPTDLLKEKKPFWQSKTILTIGATVATSIFANPPTSKQDWIQTGIVIGGGLLAGIFRKTATKNL